MAVAQLTRIGATFGILFGLAACEEPFLATSGADSSIEGESAPVVATSETRELERPDIFSASETGLWDGRPSLGGIWVAHPDVTDPERVRVTIPETGRSVTAALFKRERNNPGPRIQVSSDAAAALGMLGGQPATLEVVALRTERIEIAPPPAPEPELDDAAEDAPVSETEDGATDAAVAGAAAVVAAAPAPRRPSFWDRLTGRNRNAEATDVVVDAPPEDLAGQDLGVTAEPAPEVESAPLDAVAVAAAAIARAEADEAPEPTEASADAPDTMATPYIQIGVFSDETDADAAATALRQSGIPPIIKPLTNDSGTLWRVLVGPILSNEEQVTLLADVRGMGYPDAFPTAD